MTPGQTRPRTPVCAGCGVIAPAKETACASCDAPLASPRAFAPDGELFFVALRATWKCRACDFPTPLDGLVTKESLDCAQCGSLQRFEASVWQDGLRHAHAVGDLGGAGGEGRSPHPSIWIGKANPHAKVGLTETFAGFTKDHFFVEASPGWPVCHRCHVLLRCTPSSGGAIATECPKCAEAARFAMPRPFADQAVGVVADENRSDRREVRVEKTAVGLVALLCPQCGAAVQPRDGNSVECTFCNTVAIIPPRARPRPQGDIVEPTTFWVAFGSPSPERAALEKPVVPGATGSVMAAVSRGLVALPGIDLAPRRPGVDVKQLAVTLGATLLALGAGYLLYFLIFRLA